MQSLAIVLNASHDGSKFNITSLGKLMASQQVLLQYQEYVSLASVALNVLPIGITSNQNKTNQAAN